VRLSIEADVRRAYLVLLLVRDRGALVEQLDVLWQKSLGVARHATKRAAERSQTCCALSSRSTGSSNAVLLQAEEATTVQALNRLRNHPLDEPIDSGGHIRDLPEPTSLAARFSAEKAVARSPEIRAARLSASAGASTARASSPKQLPAEPLLRIEAVADR